MSDDLLTDLANSPEIDAQTFERALEKAGYLSRRASVDVGGGQLVEGKEWLTVTALAPGHRIAPKVYTDTALFTAPVRMLDASNLAKIEQLRKAKWDVYVLPSAEDASLFLVCVKSFQKPAP